MPHSSGGGSHGGGSHGGSHGSSSPRVSHRPHCGSRRYIYYYPGTNRYEYLYFSGMRTEPDNAQLRGAAFFSLVLLFVAFLFVKSALAGPTKTDLSSYDSDIRIVDQMELLDNSTALNDALSDFRMLTGVSPAIEVVTHADWETDYATLESFAYSEYLRMFDDEKHWLFVFSVPENTDSDFTDWAWEGMIGDDVGGTISGTAEENMTRLMQKYLLRYDMDGAAAAITGAFREFSETVMDPPTGVSAYLPAVIPLLLAVVLVLSAWIDYQRKVRLAAAYLIDDAALQEQHCPSCGCMYVEGTVDACPCCNEPIPADCPSEFG